MLFRSQQREHAKQTHQPVFRSQRHPRACQISASEARQSGASTLSLGSLSRSGLISGAVLESSRTRLIQMATRNLDHEWIVRPPPSYFLKTSSRGFPLSRTCLRRRLSLKRNCYQVRCESATRTGDHRVGSWVKIPVLSFGRGRHRPSAFRRCCSDRDGGEGRNRTAGRWGAVMDSPRLVLAATCRLVNQASL